MVHVAHDRRLVRVPEEHRAFAAEQLRKLGVRAAAKRLGFGRSALLAIIATGECMPGTAALLREAIVRVAA